MYFKILHLADVTALRPLHPFCFVLALIVGRFCEPTCSSMDVVIEGLNGAQITNSWTVAATSLLWSIICILPLELN
ncbi:hypothetical protein BKA70DRAFT_851911 [Coprinopsis sp. MPI-PUGE-AT-0042]|nr:hypothetical protein BKA70DRAFT_851911 [Coprinopsis sp. MPI-PUGE-AT-0042]